MSTANTCKVDQELDEVARALDLIVPVLITNSTTGNFLFNVLAYVGPEQTLSCPAETFFHP